jgi:hypothetical protein
MFQQGQRDGPLRQEDEERAVRARELVERLA